MNLIEILKAIPLVLSILGEIVKLFWQFKPTLPANHPDPVKAFVATHLINPTSAKIAQVQNPIPQMDETDLVPQQGNEIMKQIDKTVDSPDFKRIEQG